MGEKVFTEKLSAEGDKRSEAWSEGGRRSGEAEN